MRFPRSVAQRSHSNLPSLSGSKISFSRVPNSPRVTVPPIRSRVPVNALIVHKQQLVFFLLFEEAQLFHDGVLRLPELQAARIFVAARHLRANKVRQLLRVVSSIVPRRLEDSRLFQPNPGAESGRNQVSEPEASEPEAPGWIRSAAEALPTFADLRQCPR